ncbi:MAG: endopeptidase La, partial [Negativicutes bacterium]|nr:endopeptidase La [Negativicutes bacterium]
IKVIQKELGEAEEKQAEKERMTAMLEAIQGISADNKEKLSKEINRLEKMPASTPEAAVLRQYLDTVFQLPWDTMTEDVLDIKAAETILNQDHYALEKPKERILEYLAVRQLSHSLKGPILCLVGPPGTGKTSLAKSVARALNRKFVRLSLGGVRDEAEIRGHRRTYVASMPGRIIQGIRQVGVRNPVFLLDEVDKTSSDFRGDPASALLEVLDGEQNNTFSDHYLEIPFDLSQVLFITTANNAREIPRPLLDRMELIELSGYTEEEKFEIAKRHLIPKQLQENGLREDQLQFADKTLARIISAYTREAGVRQLERQIGKICRKRARQILSGEDGKLNLTANKLEKFLGPAIYSHTVAEKQDQIGVATGMVWTELGGEILPIEVSILAGKGDLILTGKLGEVMRESARIALSYVRSKGEAYGLPPEFYQEKEIHIHAPEGSVPKEGPSAGVTLVTALVSAFTKIPVRRDVAMTGEITLRGNILPIGGLKEKLLAAYRAGIYEAVIPEENRKDMEELPESIQRKMTIHYAENYEQALGYLLPELERRIKQMKREKKEE